MTTASSKLHFQRYEFKYFLPRHWANQLASALLPHMQWDPYASGDGTYRVNSLYFDSPDFGCFWDKEAGVADRKKLRLRYYGSSVNPETEVFAEIKRKSDALIIKDRIAIRAKDCAKGSFERKISELARQESGQNEFLSELQWFRTRNALRPKLMVSYSRRALVGRRDKRFRVTIDEDIKTYLQDGLFSRGSLQRKVFPTGVVVEVKYNNILPAWFHRVLQTFELGRLAYSKYCNSLRLVMPQFDDNNYQLTY